MEELLTENVTDPRAPNPQSTEFPLSSLIFMALFVVMFRSTSKNAFKDAVEVKTIGTESETVSETTNEIYTEAFTFFAK